jgi:fumarate hydratase subunit beta
MSNEDLKVETPLSQELARSLRAGRKLLISGTAYVARDLAHKRMVETLNRGGELPFDPEGHIIYYAGPTPARPGRPIGAIGPTTSYRMDSYTEELLKKGLRGMIGKGVRDSRIKNLLSQYGALYLAATGGAGALLASRIVESEVIAYEDLGPEALRRIVLENFPVYVAYDAAGGDMYEQGQRDWQVS